MRVYDISPTLRPETAVFPGDTAFSRNVAMSFEAGHHLALSAITTTLHIGAHADAASHYAAEGVGIDRRSLSYYVGPAVVVRSKVPQGERVNFEHLSEFGRRWLDSGARLPARFLLYTGTFPDPCHWNSDFSSYHPQLIERLAAAGVKLIGIDTPSIDPETSKALESHQTISRLEMAVLEGICLGSVPEGEYTLFAAPLKIANGDAGPVRALLIEGKIVDASLKEPQQFTWIECEPPCEAKTKN